MFVVSITYTATADQIAAHRPEHLEWLKAAFAGGRLESAGPKSTRDGGILLTSHPDRLSLDAELNQDPYRIHNIATHEVVEFEATMIR
ncbi:YciI family protein [Pseudarthrobacter raffinosi]|uniref:YciI family protein n=1 Tax=Pseudarthrobacter raffinosi TaxID=2953651 RepID=UPI00208F626E|nr:YciI family protein [Pseudarthrobacter sp. MDT3-9]MCO4251233.1 YciI family protein [Pseudarthrobacter sp. MDT3-9]